MNINHLNELPNPIKDELFDYIYTSFSDGKDRHTAYGLKQRFTRLHPNKDFHVTSSCFMEAMVSMGYEAIPIPGLKEPDWSFHLKVLYPEP